MYNYCMNTRKDKTKKIKSTFTLSDEAKALLRQMSDSMGISMTDVLELLIREGDRRGVYGEKETISIHS